MGRPARDGTWATSVVPAQLVPMRVRPEVLLLVIQSLSCIPEHVLSSAEPATQAIYN